MVVATVELRLARPQRRDARAELERLYRRHSGEVLRYALRELRSHSDAEDVTQAVFIRALRALERGEQVRAPRSWLIKIAQNECRRLFSAAERFAELPDQLPTEPEEAGRVAELKRALAALPDSQRQALILRELEGRTYEEIATALNLSHSAVETLIFRARRSVREQLEAAMSCDEFAALLDDPAARPRIRAHARVCAACAHLERQARGRKSALRRIASALWLPWWGAKVAAVAVTTVTVAGGVAASVPPAHRQAPPHPRAARPQVLARVPAPRPQIVRREAVVHPVVATPKERKQARATVRAARVAPTRPPAAPARRRGTHRLSHPTVAAAPRPAPARATAPSDQSQPAAPSPTASAPAPAPPPAEAPAPAPARPSVAPPPVAVPAVPAPPPAPPLPSAAAVPPVPAPPPVPALPPVPAPPPVNLPPPPDPPAVPAPPVVPVPPANVPVPAQPPPPVATPPAPLPAPPPLPPVGVPPALPVVNAP